MWDWYSSFPPGFDLDLAPVGPSTLRRYFHSYLPRFAAHLNLVPRSREVVVDCLDQCGKAQTIRASGWYARILQHEIDHLDGILFIDHISKLKRDRVIKKFLKAAKRTG